MVGSRLSKLIHFGPRPSFLRANRGKDMMEERQIVDLLNVRHNQLDMFLWQMY